MSGKKLLSQSFIYGAASLLINGSNFFLIPFYTHYLQTAEYGIISSTTLFSTFISSFFVFGLNGAITRFYFDYNKNAFRSFLFTVFGFQVLISFFICLIFVVLDGIFLDRLFNQVRYDPFLKTGIWIGFFGAFSAIPLALLQAQSKALLYRMFTTLSFILLTIFMIFFIVYRQEGGMGGIRAYLISSVAMAVLYSVYVFYNCRFEVKMDYVKTALGFSFPLMVYAIFGTLTELSSKYFIERYISLSELGIYNVAQQFSSIIILVTNAINMAWVPLFYSAAKVSESSELFSSFGKFLIFVLTSMGLVFALFSEELVKVTMSPGYQDVSLYMPLLLLAYIIGNGYWILIINPLSFSKKTIYLPMLTIFSGAVAVGGNFLLVPRVGAFGAAFATCLTYLVLIATAYLPYRKFSSVRYKFAAMNGMVAIAVILYVGSTIVELETPIVKSLFKLGILAIFYLVLKYLGIYSIADVKSFLQSQFKTTQ
ncbi:MAG: oligosaccharide flippase family protein [Cyclobacteriaceae bacterium]